MIKRGVASNNLKLKWVARPNHWNMDRRKIVEQILSELRRNPVEDCVLELLPDHEILLILEQAFRSELNAGVRYNVIENIVGLVGQRRASTAMPILVEALYDESP
jgi:hypothetical protein